MKKFLLRGLLLLGGIFFAGILLEIGLTLYYVGFGAHGPLEIVPEFDSPFVFRRRYEVGNAYGIRPSGREVSPHPAPGVTRILSYGDSIGEGYRVKASQTYAHVAEERLNAGGGHYEILNMARGHSPTVYSFHIRHDVPQLEPAGVIVEIELLNDVADEARVRTRGRDADGLPREILSHRYMVGWDGFLLAPLAVRGSLLEQTKLYAKLSAWFGRVLNRLHPNPLFAEDSPYGYYSLTFDRYFLTQERLDEGFDRLFDSLAGIHRYLARRDIRFLLVILPSIHFYREDQYTDASRELVRRAEARAAELGIPYVSLADQLGPAGGADLFMDFCHPRPDGHRAIGSLLVPTLEQW